MKIRLISTAASVATLLSILVSPAAFSAAADDMLEQGRKVAFDKKLGNCLSCHNIVNGEAAGNLGPPLIVMKARFPDKAALRAQIWDATTRNAATVMPPFGKHGILSEKEIDLVTDFIHTL